MFKERAFHGVLALILTSLLWGSSFPVIKLVVSEVSSYTYTWFRSFLAILILLPYVVFVYFKKNLDKKVVEGGLLAGLAYALGLWLQGWGTSYTTASNSAFITGLNVIFVHVYVALTLRKYDFKLALALTLSLTGLYFLTSPVAGVNIGDILVLLGAVMWAAQIIIVDKFSKGDPFVFTFFEMIPALSFSILDFISNKFTCPPLGVILKLLYLALFCSVFAYALQVYGQRYISPAIASIILLMEPVFATIFAYALLSERLSLLQTLGAGMMISAMLMSSLSKVSYKQNKV